MRRKIATWPAWPRLLRRRFALATPDAAIFDGHIALIEIDEFLRPPAWIALPDRSTHFVGKGWAILQHFPTDQRHVITTMFDADDSVKLWYIDIIRAQGLDDAGIPWFDDLYLDIVVLPDGSRHVLDADELDEALTAGAITRDDRALAWAETERLLALLAVGPLPAMRRCHADLARLRALPLTTFVREAGDD